MLVEFYAATYLISLIAGAVRPKWKGWNDAHYVDGWPWVIIWLCHLTQHYTLFSLQWLVVALATGNPHVRSIALVMQTTMCIMYHSVTMVDATLLTWEDPEFTRKVTSLVPPRDPKLFLVYLCLHVQHTLCPLHLAYLGVEEFHILDVFAALAAFHFYLFWTTFCWWVLGRPAYPIQAWMLEHGWYERAERSCVMLMAVVGTTYYCLTTPQNNLV